MPSTYTLISSNVLTSSAASVTFSAIPSTYTDLVVRGSIRVDHPTIAFMDLQLNINSSSVNYSNTYIASNGTVAYSARDESTTYAWIGNENSTGSTANTFTNLEIYIPSYNSSTNKPFASFAVSENNASSARIIGNALLWRNTAAITSLQFSDASAYNFVSGSSFYLYGIKNS